MSAVGLFRDLVAAHKSGRPWGIASICSAHPAVLRAAMVQELAAAPVQAAAGTGGEAASAAGQAAADGQAAAEGRPVLIESTVNQVNQFGGYTGMTPERFRDFVLALAAETGLPEDRVLLGADHLGPYPWRDEPAEQAMEKACVLAAACVRAGYRKLHLDASMPLKGDERGPGGGIPASLVAEREAALAAAAERAAAGSAAAESAAAGGPGPLGRPGAADAPPVYVIGTDVPPPGGAVDESGIHITRVEELEETVESCRRAFRRAGLEGAWERVVAVV
ncbi:MAG: class II D-tagatose-bisphosphate aldolase, non-catalytic subunit, partial [Spirochaetales bacterium]|nr:class II D-tagatose-bisphosphate aldolase, non-catalytic subunit [Spirochaetales bacterium]